MAELVIYGRDTCGMCNKFKKDCASNGIQFRYANIEDKANRAEMSRKMRSCSWFKGGKFGLPLVDVYGDVVERPSIASVLEAKKALPSDEAVAKIKKQFKELDVNKDGALQFDEMKQMLQTLNRSLSEVQVQKLFCAADVNQNGTVELDEFIDFVMHGKQAVAKVLQEPPQGTPTTVGIRDEWKKQTLEAHNAYRKEHGSADLQWSDECYLSAKKQANACQEKSAMFHDNCSGPSGRHGQNIFWCSAPGSSAERMVKAWYDEIVSPGYDFAKATFTPGTGHFTQVVWKGSTHVGMALSEDGRFCVANYFPAGNAQSPINRSALINLTSEQVERGESVCGTLCPAKIDRTKMTKDIGTAREPLVWLATVSLRPWVCTFVSVFGGYWC
ncbi:Golgi-associated plant pathogenesis-related protein 1 (GAPR-1) (Golgi-associated PR-1 protein) (Glioma pathogenesis-related protein 2) (GliPR 2) [Durusdinium trenchii]|uniref:Golgi-associated plant pathogenesis-related protein 1 (GAPR-1) (Golgi-associated PR-1 protein) (Glioma pathogenesis-related protein 2) (GliPR 2) n=1 Tax=Durusdinium trenchii TaxID=1381693 RepID=A0ABP0NFA9_9DINO